ncbi:hypothetical protein [Nostoc sp.]
MKEQNSNASNQSVDTPIVSDKSIDTPIVKESSNDSNKSQKPWNWQKLIRTTRDVSSVVSVLITLVKIFQELGLIP